MSLSRRQALIGGAGLWSVRALGQTPPLTIAFALNRGPYDASNAPFPLAQRKGYFAAENIEADFSLSKNAEDALRRVVANEVDFGFVDMAVVLRFALAEPARAPLYVFSVFDRSPASIVTWKKSGVTRPQDLIGKTLAAVEPDGAYQLFPAFLRAAGIDPAGITLKMTSLTDREQAMLRHEVDGAIGFDSTIYLNLQKGGGALSDIDVTYYADVGFDPYSNGIIVSRRMLQNHPERIAGVVRACAKGWRDAMREPKEVLRVLGELAPSTDLVREAERLEWIKTRQIVTPASVRDGLGSIDMVRVEKTIRQIAGTETGLDPRTIVSNAYLPALADRSLG
jgi:NitT/TauT family transport system substrate-binding protein